MKINKLNTLVLITILCCSFNLYAQDSLKVEGTIIGIKNQPLSNVSVALKGHSIRPILTDSLGNFAIQVPGANGTLLISPSSGYKTQSYFLGNKTELKIKLTPSGLTSNRDRVRNIFGFGRKRDIVAANSQLELERFSYQNQQTVDNQIKGSTPGVWGIGKSGMPGAGSALFIRGIHTMNANTQPLFIVDGLPLESHGIMESFIDGYDFNPLTGINPADITNISVLKDNTSSALYGARAANGIVLIETLSPDAIETVIDVSYKTGLTQAPVFIPQLNSKQYRTLSKELLMTSSMNEEEHAELYPGLYAKAGDPNFHLYNNDTDWQNLVFRDALMTDMYLRILGGDEIAKYGLSVGYQKNEGVIDSTSMNRFSVRFVGSFNMFSWLKLNVNSNLTNTTLSLKESARVSQTGPIYTALQKNPLQSRFQHDNDGNLLTTTNEVDELGVSNPYAVIHGFFANNKNYRFLTSFRMEGDISDRLKIHSNIGINFNSLNEQMFMPNHGMELYYEDEAWNAAKTYANYFKSFTNDNYLRYLTSLNQKHSIEAIAGFRMNNNEFQSDWGIAKNSHENDEYRNLQSGSDNLREIGGSNGKWNRLTVYGNLAYNYLNKYYIDLNVASQYSSRVGNKAENVFYLNELPFGLFYGAGFSWRLSNEAILNDTHWVDDLSLSLSYGKTGNDDIGNYDAFRYYTITHYRNTTGLIPGPIVDGTLTFEDVYQLNAGLDFTTWGNRLNVNLELYQNRTENLRMNERQNFYQGFATRPASNGEIENRGWDLSASGRVLDTKRFTFDLRANLSRFKNTILSMDETIISPFTGGEFISVEGDQLASFYGFKYKGVFASTADAEMAQLRNSRGTLYGAGDAIFEDISGPEGAPDHVIDEYDKQVIGSPLPLFYGGISSHLQFDNWHLDVSVQGVYGNEVFNYVRSVNESMENTYNQSVAVLNRWQYEGQQTTIPRAVWKDPMGNAAFSDRWIEDGSYLRLKDITLRYTIPGKFMVFRNAEFYITGMNLLTFSNYLGYDPEFAFSYNAMEQGIDYGLTPHTQTYLIGVKLGL